MLLYCWHSAHCWWMTLIYTILVTRAHAVPIAITRGDKIHVAYSLKSNSNLCNHIIKIGPVLPLYLSITEQHTILWFYEIATAIWFHKDYNYKPIVPVARDPLYRICCLSHPCPCVPLRFRQEYFLWCREISCLLFSYHVQCLSVLYKALKCIVGSFISGSFDSGPALIMA